MKRVALTILLLGAAVLLSNAFAATSRADNPRRERQVVEFTDTVRLHGALLRGQYLIVHDKEMMARGEPCTYIYRGKTEQPEKLVIAFHCEHVERARTKEFKVVIYNQHTPYSTPEVQEFQFANSTAGHRVP
jgi:hypothetical protein